MASDYTCTQPFMFILEQTRKKKKHRESALKYFLMGAVKRYSYPKYVWSPSGGWWCNPRNWKRNLAFVYLATAAICVPIVWLDWQLERRYCPPPKPVWSQRFCKHSAEDDPRFAK